jgi:alpha-L-fucosidase 2
MPFGAPGAEKIVLNIDSLWSGGPFQSSVRRPANSVDEPANLSIQSYTGGNPSSEVYQYLPGIREWIFQNGTGSMFSSHLTQ